jgi:23S rRNA (adenine2030-N6)-methyltransferase
MNYRHGYHAGNFADVVKHVGRYDLAGPEASKTGEWRDGIGRIFDADLPIPVAELLAPYLDAVRAANESDELQIYPGSSLIARRIMRPEDVLVANELNASEFERLKHELGRVKNTTVLKLDARHAVKSLLPPKERRAVVLIDPPFEEKSEFADLAIAVREAMARFPAGVYLIWYPLKDKAAADRFVAEATARAGLEFLDVRLAVCAPFPGLGLTATGLLVLNPPYLLRDELEIVLPVLRDRMAGGEGNAFHLRDVVQ